MDELLENDKVGYLPQYFKCIDDIKFPVSSPFLTVLLQFMFKLIVEQQCRHMKKIYDYISLIFIF